MEPGTLIWLIANPSRVGTLTGRNRSGDNSIEREVVFPDGLHWYPDSEIEPLPNKLKPGTRLRLIDNPGRNGTTTGKNRKRADRIYWQVNFPDGSEWLLESQVEQIPDSEDPIDQLETGRLGRIIDLRRNLTYIRLNGQRDGFSIISSLQGLRPRRGWNREDSDNNASKLAQFLDEIEYEKTLLDLLIIDEAHYLRNPESMTSKLGKLFRPVSENILLSDIGYRCCLSKQLNPVSRVTGEDHCLHAS